MTLLSVDDEISSISGSDSAASDISDSDSGNVIRDSMLPNRRSCVNGRQQQRLLLRNSAGQLFSIHRCVFDLQQVRMFPYTIQHSVFK